MKQAQKSVIINDGRDAQRGIEIYSAERQKSIGSNSCRAEKKTTHGIAIEEYSMDRMSARIGLLLLAWLSRSRNRKLSFTRCFRFKDIRKATDGFRRIIYSNSHGSAYRARFKNGEVALVKEATVFDEGRDDFYEEVQLFGRLHHRHLLTLRGVSIGNKRLLVFDNIDNGSLKEHLNDPLRTPLNWKTRLQIATGVAAAMEYLALFSGTPTYRILISSSSIMLDENFTAKVSDVSLYSASRKDPSKPHASCSEACLDRECGEVMFQLGVLILELITGQSSDQEGSLIQWVQESQFGNSIERMIDPDLGNDYNSRELKVLLAVARLCIKSREEPSSFCITHVYRYLQMMVDIPKR